MDSQGCTVSVKDKQVWVEWYPLAEVVKLLDEKKWSWPYSPETKYIEIRVDTRDNHCLVFAGQLNPNVDYDDQEDVKTSPPRRLIAKNLDQLKQFFADVEERIKKGRQR